MKGAKEKRGLATALDSIPAPGLVRRASRHGRHDLLSLHVENKFLFLCELVHQLVASLPGERLEVPHRTRIGRHYAQDFPAVHFSQRFLGLQDRQRTIQTACVELSLKFHFDQYTYSRMFAGFYSKTFASSAMQQNLPFGNIGNPAELPQVTG